MFYRLSTQVRFLAIAGALALVANSAYAESAGNRASLDKKTGVMTTSGDTRLNARALRRMDFRIEGKSCAVCLMKIQTKFKDTPGVVKVAVMLRRPYGAVVLYEAGKVTKERLLDIAVHTEQGVKVAQVSDGQIDKIPTVLIPLYKVPAQATQTSSNNTTKP